ncbi:MAG TPA: TldD/PmbA family protein [Actinomycetota bacterium]|nr:TldD/PmbA family protein [Actinomycetota bacterium]
MPDLGDLCRAAVEAATGDEQVEAFAEERTTTEVDALRGEVEGLTFAESRGVGVRVISGGRLGFAYAADPSLDEVRDTVARARENAALASEDPFNALPEARPIEMLDGLYSESLAAMSTEDKVPIALGMERLATSTDPRVTKTEAIQYGDVVGRIAIASTTGVEAEDRGTGCWCVAVTLAEQDDDTQTGFSYKVGHRLEELDPDAVALEAVERAARLLGAAKPETARVPAVLDPVAASAFLGVLSGGLSAEAVQKQRSLFASLVGEQVASDALTLVDDGRLLDGPAAAPVDGEGVPTGRTELISNGVLNGFLHNTYTALRGGASSTGNATRGYRSTPGVGTTNLFVEPGTATFDELLRRAEGGVLIQDVTGVHSGANPISGEFSVGATGLRITDGALGEPVREMTVASTIPEMLRGIQAVGDTIRWFSSVGTPPILLAEVTLGGT